MGRTATVNAENINLEKQLENATKEKEDMSLLIQQMQEQMKQMQEQMNKPIQAPNVVIEQTKAVTRKTRVISLIHNMLVLSTQEMGAGKVFRFPKFGDNNTIRLDDLDMILSIPQYRKQAEEGIFYICDADVVEELGLSDYYEKINTKSDIETIMELKDEYAVDRFMGMSNISKDSIATSIAENMAKGKIYDRNILSEIKNKSGIDIEKMSEQFKNIKDKL